MSPEDIRPALQRAWRKVEEGMVGFVNVKTDYRCAPRRCGFPLARPQRRTPRDACGRRFFCYGLLMGSA
jgi:hypothetical protein